MWSMIFDATNYTVDELASPQWWGWTARFDFGQQ